MQPEDKEARNTPKTRWWRIATITIISLLVIVGGLLTWLINDTNRTQKALERLVSTLTDRPFHIYGDFDFTLGSEITTGFYATNRCLESVLALKLFRQTVLVFI